MTIQSIIKKAVKRVELEGKSLTPEFYVEAFCKEAKKAGITHEDCTQLDKYKKTLNKDFQTELSRYNIKTTAELIRFLISKLNRTNTSHCTKLLESNIDLSKKILYAVGVLHNKQASDLAANSLKLLSNEHSTTELEQFKQLWTNFLSSYDDSFLEKLTTLGSVDSENLKKTIENLKITDESSGTNMSNEKLSKIATLLVASLVPSIAPNAHEKIMLLSKKIKQNPKLLDAKNIDSEIKKAISLRIALDQQSVKEMVLSLDGVLDKLSSRLIEMIDSSDSSNVEIKKIKEELESYNSVTEKNFKTAHKKLFTIALALEQNTQSLSADLRTHSDEVQAMSKKIHELEKELEKAKEASKEDFLTKLYNKRALDEYMKVKEGEFERYGHNYSIVMFDLDHFKAVNDTYGHDAGDAVLSAFAKILKHEVRTVDIVGRFGGEEFMAILGETDADGGAVFAEKVRAHVERSKFIYKGTRIEVTVSCGVSERKLHPSLNATIKSSDDYLYKAKTGGRNRVAYKN